MRLPIQFALSYPSLLLNQLSGKKTAHSLQGDYADEKTGCLALAQCQELLVERFHVSRMQLTKLLTVIHLGEKMFIS